MNSKPLVSIIMPVRNEEDFIRESLGAIFGQDYEGPMEVIVADGMSDDGTKAVLEELQKKHSNLVILENPKKIVSFSMNAGIRQARGKIIIRVDGHTKIAADYVRCCVEELQGTGADNVGGRMVAEGKTDFSKAVAAATSSVFGIGNARFHYADKPEWVDTVYMGAWPREVFEKNGYFDEELVRNQDDELNCRIRRNGGRIFLSPKIKSVYAPRQSPRTLWKQYFEYGFWKVRVLQKHPCHMQWRQFVPFLFVGSLAFSFLFGWAGAFWQKLFWDILFVYALANLGASAWEASRNGWQQLLYLPWVFATLHVAYGAGFLWGLIKFSSSWGKSDTYRYIPQNPVLHFGKCCNALFQPIPEGSPMPDETCLFFSRGREAIAAALKTFLKPGDEVLVPAYICTAVAEAVKNAGGVTVFYDLLENLQADPKSLEAKSSSKAKALIGVRYFGFPCAVSVCENFARKRNLLLIEDCAHALFEDTEDSRADFRIFSFPKFYPVPDGAVLRAGSKEKMPSAPVKYGWKVLILNLGDLIASALASCAGFPLRGALRESGTIKKLFYQLHGLARGQSVSGTPAVSERVPMPSGTEYNMSFFSRSIVGQFRAEEIIEKRRRNYESLAGKLKGTAGIKIIFEELPSGVCPVAFPVLTEHRDRLRSYLLSQGIETSILWSGLPVGIEPLDFPRSAEFASRNLTLPIHQDLDEEQMEYLARQVRSAMKAL